MKSFTWGTSTSRKDIFLIVDSIIYNVTCPVFLGAIVMFGRSRFRTIGALLCAIAIAILFIIGLFTVLFISLQFSTLQVILADLFVLTYIIVGITYAPWAENYKDKKGYPTRWWF